MKHNRSLTILLGLSLIVAIFTLRDYGESWDELKLYDYAADSLKAYTTWPGHGTIPVTGDHFENYGPAYVMFSSIVSKSFTRIFPVAQSVDVKHFVYFMTFLVGVWAFYQLAARWMNKNAALGATLLFMTQPLFWGHAFINPKDIPLLAFFLLTAYLGMRMHDSIFGGKADSVSAAWNELTPRAHHVLISVTIIWLASIIILFGGTPLIHQWLDSTIRAAANGAHSWIER